jgi:hypothetical protein
VGVGVLDMLTTNMLNFSKRLSLAIALSIVTLSACSNNEHAHTTVVTQIPPPPHQLLTEVSGPTLSQSRTQNFDQSADSKKPFLVFTLENGRTFHIGEDIPIDFSVWNAKLKGDGGEFRVRYIADDDDMKWLDTAEPKSLRGWLPGKHTIRMELIGPDGWPYKNGNANIVTKEITVLK